MSKIQNLIKWAKVSLPDSDSDNIPRSQVSYLNKVKKVTNLFPYGMSAVPPKDSLAVLLNMQGSEDNVVGIPTNPQTRFKGLKEGEVKYGNFSKNNSVYFKNDGTTELNGGDFQGLIKINNITTKLNKLVTEHNTHTHTETGTVTSAPLIPASSFAKTDYENAAVAHGSQSVASGGGGAPSGAGILSINGLTAQAQSLAVGVSGTDFTIASAGNTHTFNIPTASAANRGLLNSADWINFDSKLSDISGEDHSTLNNLDFASAGHTGFEKSLTFQYSLKRTVDTINLDGDSASPGNSKYYGTNGVGAKGFFALPTSAVWGSITGTLSNQTDLQNALDAKESVLTFSTGLTRTVDTITTNDAQINHDNLLNYVAGEHFLQSAITQISNTVSDGILTTSSGTLGSTTDNSANWDTAFGWGNHAIQGYLKNIVEDTTPHLGADLDANGFEIYMDDNKKLFFGNGVDGEIFVDNSDIFKFRNSTQDKDLEFYINKGSVDTLGFKLFGATGNFSVNGNSFYVDAVNNRIGVGTPTPTAQLHVSDTGTAVLAKFDRTDGATMQMSVGATQAFFGSISNHTYTLISNSINRLRIQSDGMIKVGTGTSFFKFEIDGTFGFTPSGTQSLTAGTALTVTDGIMRVAGSGGAVTITATPSIATPAGDGLVVIIQGDSDTNTVTYQDESNLAGSKLKLNGDADVVLGKGDTMQLAYDSGDGFFYEIPRR